MRIVVCLWLAVAAPVMARTITGAIYETGTRLPIAGATVSAITAASAGSGAVAHTDSSGRYTLENLATPGTYRITVSATLLSASRRSRTVKLEAPGLSGIDFEIDRDAEISGTVVNEDGQSLRGISVHLLSRSYALGQLKLIGESAAQTDASGVFRISRVEPGKEYLLLARASGGFTPVSRIPDDPGGRKPALRPTLYPDPVVAKSGERRDGIEIRMSAGPNLCIEAQLEANNEPGPLQYRIADEYPNATGRAGPAFVKAPADGRIRICDLGPGEYRIAVTRHTADPRDAPLAFGESAVSLTDRDAKNVVVQALPRLSMSGEARWNGATADAAVSVFLQPLDRAAVERERPALQSRTGVPGNFHFPALIAGDYGLRIVGLKRGQYLKDVTYGTQSVLHKPVPIGAPGMLRVILALDGGALTVKAAPDEHILLIPAGTQSEASLVEEIQQGAADQDGVYVFETVPPGRYYVRRRRDPVGASEKEISDLWRTRAQNREVEVGPRASVNVTLEGN